MVAKSVISCLTKRAMFQMQEKNSLNGSGVIYFLGLLNRFRILLPSPSFFLASDPFGAVSPPDFVLSPAASFLVFFAATTQGF
jgi:hypothetical protein